MCNLYTNPSVILIKLQRLRNLVRTFAPLLTPRSNVPDHSCTGCSSPGMSLSKRVTRVSSANYGQIVRVIQFQTPSQTPARQNGSD